MALFRFLKVSRSSVGNFSCCIFFFNSLAVLNACGKKETSQSPQTTALTGSWISICTADSSGEKIWNQVKITFAESSFDSIKSTYTAAGCAADALDYGDRTTGTYSVSGENIDLKSLDMHALPATDKAVELFKSICANVTFEKGKETSTKACPEIASSLGKTNYSSFKIESNVLTFAVGDSTTDGSTAEKRSKKMMVGGYTRVQ